MKKTTKKRYWTSILYPESLIDDWESIINKKGIMWACSPLHDKDLNSDGELKKAHYHILLCYSGPTTENVVNDLLEELSQSRIAQPIDSVRGLFRYFTHKDNPEKYQYQENLIRSFNGFNIADFYELSKTETSNYIKLLQEMIIEKDLIEYSDFLDLLLYMEPIELYIVATTHTILFDKYICSRRNKKRY